LKNIDGERPHGKWEQEVDERRKTCEGPQKGRKLIESILEVRLERT
jgi:hypothetical protein